MPRPAARRRMRGAVVLTILVLLAAGCIAKPAPAAQVNKTNTSAGFLAANESTAAPDGRGEIAAFKESNRTVTNGTDAMQHKHDYWKGQTRMQIASWDSGLIPIPLIPEGKAPGTAIADYDIPAPNLVWEGTKQLELVFSQVRVFGTGDVAGPQVDHPDISLYVDYLTAADEPGNFHKGGQAKPGTPLVIPVEPQQDDMPHQTKSLWVFRIYTGEANAFEYNLTITAVKGYDVVNWPPHPDLYANGPARVVHEGHEKGIYNGTQDNLLYGSDANWIYPERIISYGTDHVTVTVDKGAWTGPNPEPKWALEVNNASYLPKVGNGNPAGYHLLPTNVDGKTYTFDVPVDAAGYDTPYGQHSRWSFRFVPDDGNNGLPWSIEYDIKIVANGHSVATEALPR